MASAEIFFGYFVIAQLLFLFVSAASVATSLNVSTLCIKEERVALLKIKKDLKDPANCLSSWVGKDCCNWSGIQCDNQSGHVLKLDLQNLHICSIKTTVPGSFISGEINPSLTNLKHLSYLDLSSNDFKKIPIPNFIGSLNMLRYLDLSHSNFSGMVPTSLGNLSNLHYLDISNIIPLESLWIRDVGWLSALSSLQYLKMEYVNITNNSHELFRAVNMMPFLIELRLSFCNLRTLPSSLSFGNITSLSVLSLSGNHFNSSLLYWLFNMTNLTELHLSDASLRGLPPALKRENLCKLQYLDLSTNNLTGDIAHMLEALSSCSNQSMESLDLSSNQLTGKLPYSLGLFESLQHLDLSRNSLTGPIPASVGNLSNLRFLNLQSNMMKGEIPESIGQLAELRDLNLDQNDWQGTMTNIHFYNLTNLEEFSVSSKNKSLALKVTQDWVPPFEHLFQLQIHDCQVGPTFPTWLRNQMNLNELVLQNVGISGEIPHWSPKIWHLDLSRNKISGYLPKALSFSTLILTFFRPRIDFSFNQLKGSVPLWRGVSGLYLRNNLLSGTVPTNIGEEMSLLEDLDLSNNRLNGSIPISINNIQNLRYLDLSNNHLTGDIPMFWMGLRSLGIIDLSNNNLSGGIPTSICSLPSLFVLELSNNNLSANLASTFHNCTRLVTLSLRNNRFFGSMPKEITKNLPSLSELLLRGNKLTGSIPEELCHLPIFHLLDVAENNLSGSIPACLGDVQGFKSPQTYFVYMMYSIIFPGRVPYTRHIELVLKGRIIDYLNQMPVQSTIDLSSNHLSGEIPEKLTELIHLGALNLSWNKLTGKIPNSIGSLKDLECLDLSHNLLWGPIPPSMASMTFLSYLNLSYNNLSGQIPVANQFGTFPDPSIYEGNPQLCGFPLPTNCSSSSLPGNGNDEDDDKTERIWLYGSIAVGYITGFWFVCGSLVLKRSWRHAYFNFVFHIRDKLLVFIAVNLARAKRRFGLERN